MERFNLRQPCENPRVFIRADGSSEIGLGHIMRTGALAAQLRRGGAEVVYISRYPRYIKDYPVVTVPADISMAEEPAWMEVLLTGDCRALVIDHYGFDQSGLDRMAAIPGLASLFIDDMNLYEYNSSLLLNQNAYAPRLEIRGKARPLLGVSYLMMRSEFAELPPRPAAELARSILITMGAADPGRLTLKLLKMLPSYDRWQEFQWHILVGPAFTHEEEIRSLAALLNTSQNSPVNELTDSPGKSPVNVPENAPLNMDSGTGPIILHANPRGVKEIMLLCDISICAAGSSTYELAACGVPSLLIVAAENQRMVAEAAAAQGWSRNLGQGEGLTGEALWKAVDDILASPGKRSEMARRGQEAIDGQGAARVAEELLGVMRRRRDADIH